MSTVLEATAISVSVGGVRVLEDVAVDVAPGEIVGLIGPNGAGKSTLLKTMGGLVKPRPGRVFLAGEDVTARGVAARCRRGLSMTFQTPRFVPDLTVGEQLLASLRSYRRFGPSSTRERWRHRFGAIVDEYELDRLLDRSPVELTLGEVRRFEIARALVTDPAVLLVDEPASGMSADDVVALAAQLRHVAGTGVGVLLVEHNVPFVSKLASGCSR